MDQQSKSTVWTKAPVANHADGRGSHVPEALERHHGEPHHGPGQGADALRESEREWSTQGGPVVTPQVAGGISQLGFRTVDWKYLIILHGLGEGIFCPLTGQYHF